MNLANNAKKYKNDIIQYPESTYKFIAYGFDCKISRNYLGCWCGYVIFPTGYSPINDICDDDVHGGITYCHDNTIGFDCAHLTDYRPKDNWNESNCKYWTYEDVVDETTKLARFFYDQDANKRT